MTQQIPIAQHSEDISKLLTQYEQGLQNYHEIQLQDSIKEIRSRWPLLAEINMLEIVE